MTDGTLCMQQVSFPLVAFTFSNPHKSIRGLFLRRGYLLHKGIAGVSIRGDLLATPDRGHLNFLKNGAII